MNQSNETWLVRTCYDPFQTLTSDHMLDSAHCMFTLYSCGWTVWITPSPKTPSSKNPSKPSEYDLHQQKLTKTRSRPPEFRLRKAKFISPSLVSISRNHYSTPIPNTREKSHVSPLPPPAGPMLRLLIIPFLVERFSWTRSSRVFG